ncbi:hypothetical protein SFUMM280S_08784 [Streptomyces fumanus]
MTDAKHAVVMGAGLAGMLAARVLAPHVDRVTVVDRDTMPDGPYLRKGLPQARHAHLLMSGGARTIDALLPGTTDRLLAAGGHRIGLPADVVSLTAYGWQQRFQGAQFMITCSRELLDWTVREAVLRDSRITLRDGVEVVGPRVAGGRVTGVVVRPRDGSAGPVELAADFVVDCTGRGSPAKKWLAELGLPPVREETVDSGLRYSSRVFRAPAGAERDFPVVSVYPDHRSGRPGQSAVLVPIEDGRWIVTVSGTRGAEPPNGEEGFAAFAEAVRHPIVGRLIAGAEPVTEVQGSRSTHNRRLHYEQVAGWPEGFAVMGDALAAFNPVYGHGMSCAAQAAGALEGELRRLGGLGPQLGKRVQRAVSAVVACPPTASIAAAQRGVGELPGEGVEYHVDTTGELLLEVERPGAGDVRVVQAHRPQRAPTCPRSPSRRPRRRGDGRSGSPPCPLPRHRRGSAPARRAGVRPGPPARTRRSRRPPARRRPARTTSSRASG